MQRITGLFKPLRPPIRPSVVCRRPERTFQKRTYLDHRRIASAQIQTELPRDLDRQLSQYILDEQIDTSYVQVKDLETNKLGDPQSLQGLLRTINRETECIHGLTKSGERDFTIVEIIEKDVLRQRTRDRENAVAEQQKTMRQSKPKQIELNWAISENDLQMKLQQLDQFLNKGKKVEIMLAAKRRARKATPEEGQKVLKEIQAKLEEVGAKEILPMQGRVLGQVTMTVKK